MRKFKKIIASFLCALLVLGIATSCGKLDAQAEPTGVNTALMTQYGLNSNSYFWKKAIWNRTSSSFARDVLSRPYPRVIGNQFNIGADGKHSRDIDNAAYIDAAAKYLDFVFANRVRGSYSDKFVDTYDSVKNPNMGLVAYKKAVYSKASAYNRRCYVLAYHASEGIENYSPPTSGYNYWFSNNDDNPWKTSSNKGTWDLVTANNLWYKNSDGSYVQYGSYATNVRRIFDQRNATMQKYWANHAYHAALGDGTNQIDGIFADNWLRSTGPDSSNWRKGVNSAGAMLKSRWGSEKILIGNGFYSSDYNARDFGMIEDYSGNWVWDFSASDQFNNAGQLALDTSANPSKGDLWNRLARNLMTDDLFGISEVENGSFTTFANTYLAKLGKIGYPIEDRQNSSNLFSRKFTNGIAYWNNSGASRTVAVPAGLYKDINGSNVEGNVTLANHQGLILKTRSDVVQTVPAAPSNLTATASKGATSGEYHITLKWTDNSNNETGFSVSQSVNSTSSYSAVNSPATNATTADINLGKEPVAGAYYFKINAVNSVGSSNDSNIVSININPTPITPSNLTASTPTKNSAGEYHLTLNWTDNSSNETGFSVSKSTSSTGSYSVVSSPAANATSADINLGAVSATTTYYFKVNAVNSAGNSLDSNIAEVVVTVVPVVTLPTAPSNVTVKSVTKGATSGNYYINLTWSDNSANETGFEIYDSANSTSDYKLVKTTSTNVTSYGVNLGSTPATGTHYIKILAVNATGKSTDSNVATASITSSGGGTTPPPAPTISAPSNVTVKSVTKGATSGNYYVNLTWSDNSTNETGFEIYDSANSTSDYKLVKTTSTNVTSYGVNLGSTPTTGTHYIKIIAVNATGKSTDSNVATASITSSGGGTTPPPAPTISAPSNVTVKSVTKGATSGNYYINLTWSDNSTNETGFEIYDSANSTSDYKLVKTTSANVTSYGVNLGSTPTTGTHYIKIIAVNATGKSTDSNVATASITSSGGGTTPTPTPSVPTAPSNLTVKSVTKGATSGAYYVNLTWSDNSSDETGFEILYSVNSTSNYQVIKSPAANTGSYGINLGSNITKGTYYFKIRAVGKNGNSADSNVVTAKIS